MVKHNPYKKEVSQANMEYGKETYYCIQDTRLDRMERSLEKGNIKMDEGDKKLRNIELKLVEVLERLKNKKKENGIVKSDLRKDADDIDALQIKYQHLEDTKADKTEIKELTITITELVTTIKENKEASIKEQKKKEKELEQRNEKREKQRKRRDQIIILLLSSILAPLIVFIATFYIKTFIWGY